MVKFQAPPCPFIAQVKATVSPVFSPQQPKTAEGLDETVVLQLH
jgi:hypothetical protein